MTGPVEREGRSYRSIPREENHVSAVMRVFLLPLYWWVWDYPLRFMEAGCLTQHCTTPPSTGRGRTPFSLAQRCGHCSGGTERLENLLSIFIFRHLTLTMWSLLLTDYAEKIMLFWISHFDQIQWQHLMHPLVIPECIVTSSSEGGWSQGQC